MPSLICDLRPQAAELAPEYLALRQAGESLALLWPAAPLPASDAFAGAASAADCDRAWEQDRIAVVHTLPPWLAAEDFHRVVVVAAAGADALAHALLERGCEAVEIVAPAELQDLGQSWNSGRRLPGRRLTRAEW